MHPPSDVVNVNVNTNLKKLKGFRIGHLNITSLTKYIDQLRIYLDGEPLDILSINETRLDSTIDDSHININGYCIVRKDRNRGGGGVAIYYRNHLSITSREELVPEGVEAVCIEISKSKCKPFLVASLYRPPNAKIEIFDKIQTLVEKIDNEDKDIILVGDLNCDLLSKDKTCHTNRLLDIQELFQLKQLITEPTRVTVNTGTLLDLFMTNTPEKISSSGVMHLGISDHSFVYGCRKIGLRKNRPKEVETRTYKNYISSEFQIDLRALLAEYDWVSDNPNTLWEQLKTVFNYTLEIHAPTRLRRVRSQYAPWLNDPIKKAMNNRDYLKKKAVKTQSYYYDEAYKGARNHVNKLIKKAKKRYYQITIDQNKGKPKEMWKHINQLVGRGSKTTHIPSIKVGCETILDEKNIAETLNNYFVNVGPDLSSQIPQTDSNVEAYVKPVTDEFNFRDILTEEVTTALLKLNGSKSCGPDKIPARILKDSNDVITPILTQIFNCSLHSGIFPDDWKKARVSPIYKNGEKEECGNYRPISVLSVVSKLFEKLVCDQLNNYLKKNDVITKYQSGFREGNSTVSSLLSTTNSWLINMDAGLINAVLFLDLKKAFDTVDHQIMIKKLYLHGIKGVELNWFSSYFTKRSQICKVNNTESTSKSIRCGVPQGSNLGPLLFLLYINDLPNCLHNCTPALYADDSNLTVCGETAIAVETKLNSELDNVHKWLVVNKLTLNVDKTEYMLIGSRQKLSNLMTEPEIEVSIGNKNIKRVSTTKSLGIIIDENLQWKQQIDSTSKKLSKAIGVLRRVKPFISKDSLIIIYNSLVLPHFDYCSLVWGNCNKTLREKMQKLQNRAARIISGDTYEVRSCEILNKLGWKTLEERREQQMTKFVTKALRKEQPENISNMFKIFKNEKYNLRNNNQMLVLAKPKTNAMMRSFSYAGAKIWNQQPITYRNNLLNDVR